MLTLKFSFENVEELKKFMATLPAEKTAEPIKINLPSPGGTLLGPDLKPKEVNEETPEVEAAPAPKGKAPTLEDVMYAFKKYVELNNRDKAARKLASFGVKSVRDLKPEQFQDVIDAVKAD